MRPLPLCLNLLVASLLLTGPLLWGAEIRTWTNDQGIALEADYISQGDGKVTIRRATEGLENGVFGIVPGDKGMVFIGDATDFVPIEPWPRPMSSHRNIPA